MKLIIPAFQEIDIKPSIASTAFGIFQKYFNDRKLWGN